MSDTRRFRLSAGGVVLLGFLIHLAAIPSTPTSAYVFRQSQTSMLIREFVENGFDLRSPIPVLGPPYFVPFEFPMFQAMAAIVAKVTGLSASAAGGLVSLVLFELAAVLLAVLLRRWFGRAPALLALVLVQIAPFGWLWAAAPLIEFLPVAAALGAYLLLDIWVARRQKLLLVGAAVLQVIAFLVKPTTAVVLTPLLLVAMVTVWNQRRLRRWSSLVLLTLPTVAGIASAAAWTRYADSIKADSPYTEWLTSTALTQWNFGYPTQRFMPNQFFNYMENAAGIVGPILMVLALVAITVVLHPRRIEPIALALVPLTAFAVFPNLFVAHVYYSAAVMMPLIGTAALAVVSLADRFSDAYQRRAVLLFSVAAIMVGSWSSPEGAPAQYFYSRLPEPALAGEIRDSTPIDAGIIVTGCDWNPEVLYAAHRRGLMIGPRHDTTIPAEWLPTELSFVAYCGDTRVAPPLPAGFSLERVSPLIDRIVPD